MSSRVIICTGKAVSLSMRLIDEPVISTRLRLGVRLLRHQAQRGND